MNGQACDLEGLSRIAAERGLALVDDACHALGATYAAGRDIGRVGDGRLTRMSAFSFHPVKAIATGEGGAVTTNDPELALRWMPTVRVVTALFGLVSVTCSLFAFLPPAWYRRMFEESQTPQAEAFPS